MDVTTIMFAGKERSETDWRELFESVGLDLVKIWKTEVGAFSKVVGRLKKK